MVSTLGSKRAEPVPTSSDRDGTQFGQVVQRLVDGLERDVGHLAAHPLVHPLRRGVGDVTLQGTEDALPLRGDLAAVGPEEVGQGVG